MKHILLVDRDRKGLTAASIPRFALKIALEIAIRQAYTTASSPDRNRIQPQSKGTWDPGQRGPHSGQIFFDSHAADADDVIW